MSLVPLLSAIVSMLRAQVRAIRADERGMTTETVIITFSLAVLALAVVAIIATKMTNKANDIPTE